MKNGDFWQVVAWDFRFHGSDLDDLALAKLVQINKSAISAGIMAVVVDIPSYIDNCGIVWNSFQERDSFVVVV